MSTKDSTGKVNINYPYLNVMLKDKATIKVYIDSGATVSLLSDNSQSNKEKNSIKPFTGRVSDENGEPIPIIGMLPIKIKMQAHTIRTRILIFRQNEEIVHDLLLGMNILKSATLDLLIREFISVIV